MSVPDKNLQPTSSLFTEMDLEETVKEIKFDLRNAKELISYLTETVKAMKFERDEDLHRKLDEILSQRENQKEFEKKIDILREEFVTSRDEVKLLREEMKKVAEEIRNSEEMKYLKDSVETCVGYQELFVKDFENIHMKIQEMSGEFSVKFVNLEEKLQGGARATGNIGNGLNNIERKLENFERNLEEITENGQKLDIFEEKIKNLEQELKEKINLIWKTMEEMKKNLEMELKAVILESNERERRTEKDEKPAEINKKEQTIPETNLKCYGCTSSLPKNLPLREDGVSVECKCSIWNIVGKLKEGHKWMFMNCNKRHFQQFPDDKKHGDKGKCQVCGEEGRIYNANALMAVTCKKKQC